LRGDVRVSVVQLPGREDRIKEPAYDRLEPLADALAGALEGAVGSPYAFFGHSMGALLAYEVAGRLASAGLPSPGHLFLSAHAAPHVHRERRAPIARLPDDEFMAAVQRLNGLPPEIAARADFMALLIPALRADFELVESYTPGRRAPLTTPITVFGGTEDPDVDLGDLLGWQTLTGAAFRLHTYQGGHFFVETHRQRVLEVIRAELGAGSAG
jgi:surfactin synthase thioesterase subunit